LSGPNVYVNFTPQHLQALAGTSLFQAGTKTKKDKRLNTLLAELLRISTETPDPSAIRYAAEFIRRGELVAVPTDTFYGIAADPFNLAAVDQIYRVKGRPETRALPILVNSVAQALVLGRDVPYTFHRLAEKFWPGPLTILVEASSGVPLKVTANTGNVAIRWPKCAIVNALIDVLQGPITGTSGNISGQPACASALDLVEQMGDRLPLIIDAGSTPGNLASTIVKLDGDDWMIMREGVISEQAIREALKDEGEA
jgi:tRNA threonylcarbamoyl adenosine modification protein (Sua5/YciO/YrdC/YwlC family)